MLLMLALGTEDVCHVVSSLSGMTDRLYGTVCRFPLCILVINPVTVYCLVFLMTALTSLWSLFPCHDSSVFGTTCLVFSQMVSAFPTVTFGVLPVTQ